MQPAPLFLFWSLKASGLHKKERGADSNRGGHIVRCSELRTTTARKPYCFASVLYLPNIMACSTAQVGVETKAIDNSDKSAAVPSQSPPHPNAQVDLEQGSTRNSNSHAAGPQIRSPFKQGSIVERAVVYSFRNLQLERIAVHQERLLELSLEPSPGGPDAVTRGKRVDEALEAYGKRLKS